MELCSRVRARRKKAIGGVQNGVGIRFDIIAAEQCDPLQ